MKALSQQTLSHIHYLLSQGLSTRQVAKETNLDHSTISKLRSKHNWDLPKSKGGRPQKLSPAAKRHAQRLISSGKADTAVAVVKGAVTDECGSLGMAAVLVVLRASDDHS